MRDSRRMKRMERNNKKGQLTGLGLNLIPMMDVLTVLVFFLLFHSFNGDLPEAKINLPESVVETKPRETVHIVVGPDTVMVQGEVVLNTTDLLKENMGMIYEIRERLRQLEPHLPESTAENREVTLLADKTIPFKILKKIMSTCTASGYGKISLAVIEKAVKKS